MIDEKWIAVTNRKLCKRSFLDVIKDLSNQEIETIVLREKDLSEEEYKSLAKECVAICEKGRVPLTIHNFPQVAIDLGMKRIHLPYPMFLQWKGKLNQFEYVSTSIHKVEEAVKAEMLGADFVFAGHIFQTDCKKDLDPRGLDFLKSVVDAVDIPVYGIGGISEKNIHLVKKTGAIGGCMMSGFMI